jgi:UDP-3-O-[3-hydroxymyristoyl] glucosamine N-acyltransferase
MPQYSLEALARAIGATLDGDPAVLVRGMAELETASAEQLGFAASGSQRDAVARSSAAAVIVGSDFPVLEGRSLLRIAQPRLGFIRALALFQPDRRQPGVHPSAVIAADVALPADVGIGPHAVIEAGVVIGAGCQIRAGAFIGRDTRIGARCDIGENVVIREATRIGDDCRIHPGAVLGADGYGYHWDGEHHQKIPQIGCVVLEDDVEVGANTCIDRATVAETRIGRGSRLDNLVHIAHNNRIGRHVLLTGQVGVAGSSRIGDGVVAGGQAGIADHVTVGDGVQIGAQAGVIGDVGPGEKVWGTPARPMAQTKRELVALARLPELLRRVRRQERELQALRDRIALLADDSAR